MCGLADIQLSGKREAKQARPLTVKEAQDLHRVASCSTRHLVDRIVASHLLLMMYCRCRHSDTLAVEDVLHDHSEGAGYVQLRTKFHKGSKSAAKKSLLLPIVGSSAGVGSPSWFHNRRMLLIWLGQCLMLDVNPWSHRHYSPGPWNSAGFGVRQMGIAVGQYWLLGASGLNLPSQMADITFSRATTGPYIKSRE